MTCMSEEEDGGVTPKTAPPLAQEPAPALGEQELLGEILPEDFERPFNFDPSRRPIEERVNLGPENIVLVRTDEEGKQ